MSAKMFRILVISLLISLANPARGYDKLVKFRFVHLEANGWQAVPFIAKEARLFEKNGLDVEIIRIGAFRRTLESSHCAANSKMDAGFRPA